MEGYIGWMMTEGWKLTDNQKDKRDDGWTDQGRHTWMDKLDDGRMEGSMMDDEWTEGWLMNKWMDEQMDDKWMDYWTSEWMDG